MENQFRHNEDGTTSIFLTYLDEEFETTISTEKFEEVCSIDRDLEMWWEFDSRTYYVAYKKKGKEKRIYLHRTVTHCPEDKQVHHIDSDGLNNTDGNLQNVTRKEHDQETKKKPKEPFIGDPSLGVEMHMLSNIKNSKRPFRLKVNGIPFKSIGINEEDFLRKWIAEQIMNENASDEQIHAYLVRAGYRDSDLIDDIITWVRKYTRVYHPSKLKHLYRKKKAEKNETDEKQPRQKKEVELFEPIQLVIDRVIE
ncbi:HNH endonuclease signature motif containing protein [Ectobacillus panaciterrae]|uniref:HNH endonuclease signature motif containing protein n=1 Tax=Ectobacillus panaciterrae TaxID=363872 RepID=UPI0003FA12C2|nr:HNH endonuclease signature motif containing protein [Ectobacillus panaciterrae]